MATADSAFRSSDDALAVFEEDEQDEGQREEPRHGVSRDRGPHDERDAGDGDGDEERPPPREVSTKYEP